MRYKIFVLVAAVALIGAGCSAKKNSTPAPVTAPVVSETSATVNLPTKSKLITVENQPLGNNLLIKSVTLKSAGFVAIQEEANGKPFNLIGSAFLEPGIYDDSSFIVIRKTKTGEKLFVSVYVDDGDGQFNPSSDTLARDDNGAPVMAEIEITGEKPVSPASIDDAVVPAAPAAPKAKEVTISITASGFDPAEVSIKAGDKVTWINKDTIEHWVASDVHPTHQICPTLNSLSGLGPSESFSVILSDVKTCPYHDHLNPQLTGKVTIE